MRKHGGPRWTPGSTDRRPANAFRWSCGARCQIHPRREVNHADSTGSVCARCHRPAPKGGRCACLPAWEGSAQRATRGRRWQQLRAAKLRANPVCEHPGCRRVAVIVDHVVPLGEGGAEYEWSNLASLCRPHHDEKTNAEALRGKTRAR